MADRPVLATGLVVFRGGEVLLIRRSKPPFADHWSIPGGKVGYGERIAEAALRELREETGVEAELLDLVGVFESIEPDSHFVMVDYAARWIAGEPRAADDAKDAAFFTIADARERLRWDETRTALDRAVMRRAGHDLAAKAGES